MVPQGAHKVLLKGAISPLSFPTSVYMSSDPFSTISKGTNQEAVSNHLRSQPTQLTDTTVLRSLGTHSLTNEMAPPNMLGPSKVTSTSASGIDSQDVCKRVRDRYLSQGLCAAGLEGHKQAKIKPRHLQGAQQL